MPKLKFATESNGITKFYPISITPGIIDTARNQRISVTLADLYNKIEHLIYEDVYIGTGATYVSVMVEANHHDTVFKGDRFSITVNNSKIRIIMPSSYSPAILMNGVQAPLSLSNTVTVNEIEYKVWATNNTYTGTFDMFMF